LKQSITCYIDPRTTHIGDLLSSIDCLSCVSQLKPKTGHENQARLV